MALRVPTSITVTSPETPLVVGSRTTGKVVWNYTNKAPLWGGVLTAGGNLVFTGTPTGFLKAFDAKTGEEVWKFQTGIGVVSYPITWEQDGEQWIGIAAGWGGAVPLRAGKVAKSTADINQGGSLRAFRLPKKVAARRSSAAGLR